MTKLKLPQFESEAEEAKWWYDNEELLSDEFEKAAKEGRLRRGGIQRLFAERGIPFPQAKPLFSDAIGSTSEAIPEATNRAAETTRKSSTS